MSRPSRTHTDQRRLVAARSEDLPVAWATVRDLYPARVRDRVDALAAKGGITLRDLSAMTTAQLLVDLGEQGAGADVSRQVSSHLRLLFRLAMVSGGIGDGTHALVRVPPELVSATVDAEDLGDDVTD